MISDQYIKLFSTDWIEPWMIEALAIMFGAMWLVWIICKIMDFLDGNQQ